MKSINVVSISGLLFLCLCLTGCHSSRYVKRSSDNTTVKVELSGLSKKEKALVEEALTWVGTPYGYARSDKGVATDCSGLVLKVYESVRGCKLPRNSAKQAGYCKKLKKKNVRVGDLVFFATGKNPDVISHVGIMIDDDNFIHASSSKGVVVSKLSSPYYRRTFKMYGRVPE